MSSKNAAPWALVTGASDGIGRALVHELGKSGFNVLAVGRSSEKLKELKTVYSGSGILEVHALDFKRAGSSNVIQALVAGKKVELFAPAAGFGSIGDFVDLDLENELQMIDVNCKAVVEQTQWFAETFKRQGRGTIVMFSSILGTSGAGTSAVYAATKNFIHAFSEGLREELRSSNVKVLTVSPATTNSGFAEAAKMKFAAADEATDVAKGIVKALGKNGTVYPAPRAKFLGRTLTTVPRSLRVGILTNAMRSQIG
jgi:short-subunit dehydrogenase